MRKFKAYRRLSRMKGLTPTWELWLLLLLLVTIFGIAIHGHSDPFPKISTAYDQRLQDPYDILPDDGPVEGRQQVETGL